MTSRRADPARPECAWVVNDGPPGDRSAIDIRIRLTPKSSRDAVLGLTTTPDGSAIKARVRAVPENGKANKALEALVAKWLGMPKSSITLSAGAKSRTKVLTIIAARDDLARIIGLLEQHDIG